MKVERSGQEWPGEERIEEVFFIIKIVSQTRCGPLQRNVTKPLLTEQVRPDGWRFRAVFTNILDGKYFRDILSERLQFSGLILPTM